MHKTYVVWKWESSKRDRKGEKTNKFWFLYDIWMVVSNIFIFIPTWGNDPIWLIFFEGFETTNWIYFDVFFVMTYHASKPKPNGPGVETKILAEGDPWNACILTE